MLNHHVLDFFICEQHEELVDLIQQHFCYSNFRASALTAVHCLVNSIIRQKFNSGKFCLGLCIYIYLLYTQDTMPFKGTSNLPTIIIDPFWWYLNTLSLSHFPLLFSYFWVIFLGGDGRMGLLYQHTTFFFSPMKDQNIQRKQMWWCFMIW
jgi:hypothetical protein